MLLASSQWPSAARVTNVRADVRVLTMAHGQAPHSLQLLLSQVPDEKQNNQPAATWTENSMDVAAECYMDAGLVYTPPVSVSSLLGDKSKIFPDCGLWRIEK